MPQTCSGRGRSTSWSAWLRDSAISSSRGSCTSSRGNAGRTHATSGDLCTTSSWWTGRRLDRSWPSWRCRARSRTLCGSGASRARHPPSPGCFANGWPSFWWPHQKRWRWPKLWRRPRDWRGFAFISQGSTSYLLTNNHVIQGASRVQVLMPDGRHFGATVQGADARILAKLSPAEQREFKRMLEALGSD